MPRRPSRLAKLTRPRAVRTTGRSRLFALLEEARRNSSAIWVAGPPGAGKTTLIASWLQTHGTRSIWYQVDAGDTELATFFHYLGEAALPFMRRGQRAMPALTPEYLHDVAGFARRFFRELFARMPERSVLVLDNVHEVGVDHPFHHYVADAIAEIPVGSTVVAVSRHEAPACYARAIANEQIATVGWDALKLTLDEAILIGRERGCADASLLASLHASCAGWAAGLALLLERARRGDPIAEVRQGDSLHEVFSYFAGELFDQAPPETQHLLLTLSFLPTMHQSAVHELGGEDGVPLLEDLHRRNLFVDRRSTHERVYQFHALFYAFLRHRAARTLAASEQASLTHLAARALEHCGEAEQAFPLHLQVANVDSCRSIILREAARLVGQGRWQVVVNWIAALPDPTVEADRWLLYWRGAARVAVAPEQARRDLERSFGFALDEADVFCRLCAAAGIVQTYMLQYADFRPLDPWIEALDRDLAQKPVFPDRSADLQVHAALLIALAYRRPGSAALPACVERVFELVAGDAEVNLRVTGAAYLVAYGVTTGPLEIARRARPVLERILACIDISPLTATWAFFIVAHYSAVCGLEADGRAAIARLEQIASEEGLPHAQMLACVMGAWLEMALFRLPEAQSWLDRLQTVIDARQPYDVASVHSIRMALAALQGDPASAVREGRIAIEWFDRAGTAMHRLLNRDLLTGALLSLGRIDEAQATLCEWRSISGGAQPTWLEGRVRCDEAMVLLARGHREAGLEALRSGLRFIRDNGAGAATIWKRPTMLQVVSTALENHIEPEFVRELVRRFSWPAPSITNEAWPWPIKIYALGRFQILIADKAPVFSRKVPKKPFVLLKALLAMGGREVRDQRLIDALWPQESGDAAYDAFHQALLRLRRLLGDARAVQLLDGRVSLDSSLVWTDVRAFEQATTHGAPISDRETALRLYRGDFLADETEQPWTASTRERLRGKFIHLVTRAAQELEAATRWEDALALYMRGLDADSLAESFYQGIMRCHAARDRRAEALSVYRRMRQQLSVVLGMQPSPSSEALARQLMAR